MNFTSIPFDRMAGPAAPEVDAELARAVALTRYVAGVGLGLTV